MKLLHANDELGRHPPSWYQASCETMHRSTLQRHIKVDVCIIGAGFTGLGAAIELGRAGAKVALLDAHRIGWGASGRNGGQLGSGFNQDQCSLEKSLGSETAHRLWQQCQEAKQDIHTLCAQHSIDIDYHPGIVSACHRKRNVKPLHDYCNYLTQQYYYSSIETLDEHEIRSFVNSDAYYGGAIDHDAGHIHPLKLVLGMARVAESLGVHIYDQSEALNITQRHNQDSQRIVTAQGSVVCDNLIIATNGYSDDLQAAVKPWVIPINNFIVVTEPLGDQAKTLLPQNTAVADSRFVVNYFRRVDGDRLLFGGGENYRYTFPKQIRSIVRKAMGKVFPSLNNVELEYAWGGTLAITRSRLPYVNQFKPGRYFAGGYSGHGVALAALYGKAIAEDINGQSDRLKLLQQLPVTPFPGSQAWRPFILAAAMTGYSWLDKL